MVGTPLKRYFEEIRSYQRGKNLFLFDINPAKGFQDDVRPADIIFICVPTPRAPDGSADLSAVKSAIARIPGKKIVVIKSTVPPGTTEYFQKQYPRHRFLFNPEFLTEARAWEQTIEPDRQLVGWTKRSRLAAPLVLATLPRAHVSAPSKQLTLTATEAEIIKYAANVFLARKVVFANAIYDLAAHHGADYENIRAGVASDSRIGPSHLAILHNGYRGYGGFCFTKDTDAFVKHCEEVGLSHVAEFIATDRLFNERLLHAQGLTPEDVSVHDEEWVEKKVKGKTKNAKR